MKRILVLAFCVIATCNCFSQSPLNINNQTSCQFLIKGYMVDTSCTPSIDTCYSWTDTSIVSYDTCIVYYDSLNIPYDTICYTSYDTTLTARDTCYTLIPASCDTCNILCETELYCIDPHTSYVEIPPCSSNGNAVWDFVIIQPMNRDCELCEQSIPLYLGSKFSSNCNNFPTLLKKAKSDCDDCGYFNGSFTTPTQVSIY